MNEELCISTANAVSIPIYNPAKYATLVTSISCTSFIDGETITYIESNGTAIAYFVNGSQLSCTYTDGATANSTVLHIIDDSLVDDATAISTATTNTFRLYTSTGNAVSVTIPSTTKEIIITSNGVSSSTVFYGNEELVTSQATFTERVNITINAVLKDAANAVSQASDILTPKTVLVVERCVTADSTAFSVNANAILASYANAYDRIIYKNPDAKALLTNTETTAAWMYNNFDFESVLSWMGVEIAVGPEGIYELTGDTDEDQPIDSYVQTGYMDFGTDKTKRLENIYLAYTSDGRILITPEVYESGHSPMMYALEQRQADAPRNSRVTPGKGLYGRYWRFTVANEGGSNFEIHDLSADVAVSTRRV